MRLHVRGRILLYTFAFISPLFTIFVLIHAIRRRDYCCCGCIGFCFALLHIVTIFFRFSHIDATALGVLGPGGNNNCSSESKTQKQQ
jgi:hypothetical protein